MRQSMREPRSLRGDSTVETRVTSDLFCPKLLPLDAATGHFDIIVV